MDDLEDLFRRHQTSLYAYILGMVGDPATAEECTQEAFYRACVAAVRFSGRSSIRTWLFGIAKNVVREAARRPRTQLITVEPAGADADPSDRIFLQQALSRLGENDREVLILIDALGFPHLEVADLLDISPEATRVRLHRARTRLREAVRSWDEEDVTDG